MPLILILSALFFSAGLAGTRRRVGVPTAGDDAQGVPEDDEHTLVVAIVRGGQVVGHKRVARGRG